MCLEVLPSFNPWLNVLTAPSLLPLDMELAWIPCLRAERPFGEKCRYSALYTPVPKATQKSLSIFLALPGPQQKIRKSLGLEGDRKLHNWKTEVLRNYCRKEMFLNIKKALWIALSQKTVFCAPAVPGIQSDQDQILPSPLSGTALLTSTVRSHEPGSRVQDLVCCICDWLNGVKFPFSTWACWALAVRGLSRLNPLSAHMEWAQHTGSGPRDFKFSSHIHSGPCCSPFGIARYQFPSNSLNRFFVTAGICCITREESLTHIPAEC